MNFSIKQVTLGDFLDAMEKNGYPKSSGMYIRRVDVNDENSAVIEACAMGQAALNLEVDPQLLHNAVSKAVYLLPTEIYAMNDNTGRSVAEIARHFREVYRPFLLIEISIF